jgi:thymidine kinase
MSKLYFRYGAVSSAKTLNLLAVAHTYKQQGKKVVVLKPALDVRFGKSNVKSRAGLDREADFLLEPKTILPPALFDSCHCVLVDEAQFVSGFVIDQLRHLVTYRNVPVIAYGLKVDFRTQLFEGSKRLFEVADSIEEVKTTCYYCNKKAIYNLKSADGTPTLEGPQRTLGCEELYLPVCGKHFNSKLNLDESGLELHQLLNQVDLDNAAALVASASASSLEKDDDDEIEDASKNKAAQEDQIVDDVLAPKLDKIIDLTSDNKI